ncbi:hypothetical protein F7Q99_04685 [Streptomyces kaniharaensis]|uniref:Uncharacterized protein n=1 Tax=Streptomyces kaniharaensis TaxID=212423 RepID=A0A6N7KJC7_9ACTN|nr:hypothetical protein [Streptomyces kaniharaensis]MQS11600.1 hypothetical protein [Streptomyces kaniharaensis]
MTNIRTAAGRRRAVLLGIGAALPLAGAGAVYDALYVRSLDFGERCERGLVSGGGQLLETGASWLPPDAWCRFEDGSVSTTPFWALLLFYSLLTVTVWAVTALLRARDPRPRPGLDWQSEHGPSW